MNRLTTLRAAVELESAELERLHKIDVAATALDLLVQENAKQKAQFETEMAAQQSMWEETVEKTERERKEQEDALKKQRQREIDEYEYKKTLERKRAQDKYEEEIRQQEKKNQERQDALGKSWRLVRCRDVLQELGAARSGSPRAGGGIAAPPEGGSGIPRPPRSRSAASLRAGIERSQAAG